MSRCYGANLPGAGSGVGNILLLFNRSPPETDPFQREGFLTLSFALTAATLIFFARRCRRIYKLRGHSEEERSVVNGYNHDKT